jgi:hypothetical protein
MHYDEPGQFFDAPNVFYDGFQPATPKKRMAKPKLNLSKLTVPGKIALAQKVITGMTANANFPTPNPTLAAMTTGKTTLQTKLDAVEAGKTAQKGKVTELHTAEDALDALLSTQAATVQSVSGGDATKILSAGMQVADAPGAVVPPGQVLNLVLTAGDNVGSLDFAFDATPGAHSYEFQLSVDPVSADSWTTKMTVAKSSGTATGLTSGARMWGRARAIGADPQPGPWSDPAAKTVP